MSDVEARPKSFEALYLMEIDSKLEMIRNALIGGKAGSYDEYRYMSGQYLGLSVARNLFVDRIRQLMQADDAE